MLAACGPAAPPANKAEPPSQVEPPGASAPAASWIASESGAELTFRDADGSAVLSLACANGTMVAVAPAFREIGSEERFSLGADDQVFILVAQLGQANGVRAEGTPADYFLDRLPSAAAVHANYGAQNLGPLAPPAPEQARAFAAACRGR